MTTVQDVARKAGVSRATVSRVVSNRGYVSADARARVLQAVDELHYVPNAMARGLKTRRSGLVALIVPEFDYSFYTTIARGVEDVTSANDLHVILGNTDESLPKEKSYLDLMLANRVDGIILASAGHSARHLRPVVDRGMPMVQVDRVLPGFPADAVRHDNVAGAEMMTRHLIAHGHRRIAFVNGDPGTSVGREREAGYRLACREAGISPEEQIVSVGAWSLEDGESRVLDLLVEAGQFTALFAANALLVTGALRALRRQGLRAPEDMALACFDDIEGAADIDPFLTVVVQPAYAMGRLAAQLLLERIGGAYAGTPRDVVVSPRLIVRRSAGEQTLTARDGVEGESERLLAAAASHSVME